MTPKFILASNSPRRRELLSMIGVDFEVKVSDCDENADPSLTPDMLVRELAKRKAEAVADKLPSNGHFIVIGADTVVSDGVRIFGKPIDKRDAVDTLLSLSGKTHSVFTGIAVIELADGKMKAVTDAVETKVVFGEISRAEAEFYAGTGEPMDKAGAYGVQGIGGFFVNELHGDYYNVVGLPIARLRGLLLEHFGLRSEEYIGRRLK